MSFPAQGIDGLGLGEVILGHALADGGVDLDAGEGVELVGRQTGVDSVHGIVEGLLGNCPASEHVRNGLDLQIGLDGRASFVGAGRVDGEPEDEIEGEGFLRFQAGVRLKVGG